MTDHCIQIQESISSFRLPVVDIEVPQYELPLPEGVGEEHLQYSNLTVREIEEGWKERLHDSTLTHVRHPSQ